MAKNNVSDSAPLSRFGVLVAQLESIVVSASEKNPDPLLCFEIFSDLISALDEEPKSFFQFLKPRVYISMGKKMRRSLYSPVTLGARRPVRHLASMAMGKLYQMVIIYRYTLELAVYKGFFLMGRGVILSELQVVGVAQCLGDMYRHFGRKITSCLIEKTVIVTKLVKFNEDFVRQEAFILLHNALEGCSGTVADTA